MKKTLIALAVLTVSTASFAQSSVTLSGKYGFGVNKVGTSTATTGLTDGALTFGAVEDLGGGMKVTLSQSIAVKGEGTNAVADGGYMKIEGGFGSLQMGQACAGAALGEGNLGGVYGLAHAYGAGTDCSANWRYSLYTLPSMVPGLTVAARISRTVAGVDPSIEGFSAAENSAQIRLAYANGPMSVAYYARSTTGEVHASYNLGFATVKFGMDTKTSTATKERTEVGVSVPMGATTLSLGYGKQKDTNVKGTQLGVSYALSKRTSVNLITGSFNNNTDNVDSATRLSLVSTF